MSDEISFMHFVLLQFPVGIRRAARLFLKFITEGPAINPFLECAKCPEGNMAPSFLPAVQTVLGLHFDKTQMNWVD